MARKNIIFLIITVLCILSGCTGKVDPSFLFEKRDPAPDSTMVNAESVQFNSFTPVGRDISFISEKALFDLENRVITSEGVFFKQKNDKTMTLEAESGHFDLEKQSFLFYDNVIYRGFRGEKLQTSQLKLDNMNDIVSTDKEFRFQTASGRIEGKGFKADTTLSEVQFISAYGYEGEKNEE